jgi:hypothetical protein
MRELARHAQLLQQHLPLQQQQLLQALRARVRARGRKEKEEEAAERMRELARQSQLQQHLPLQQQSQLQALRARVRARAAATLRWGLPPPLRRANVRDTTAACIARL